jgi:protein-L-isoaspartate(D-aspartate) O-methyltransferase
MRVLDVGCGKAHLLYEFTQVVPGLEVAGVDISAYDIANAKPEVKPFLKVTARRLVGKRPN